MVKVSGGKWRKRWWRLKTETKDGRMEVCGQWTVAA